MLTEVDSILRDGGTLVTATHRLARSLRHQFDRHCQAAGRSVWPTPDVLPWDAWLDRLWERAALAGAPAGGRAVLSDAAVRLLWREIIAGEGSNPATDADVLEPLAVEARALLYAWRIDPALLGSRADSDATRAFDAWNQIYEQRLDALNCIDTPQLPALLAADLESGRFTAESRLGFVGFDPWPPAAEGLVGALATAGARVARLGSQPLPGAVSVRRCRDPGDEMRRAAWWARRQLETDPDRRIAVIVDRLGDRSDEVRRTFFDILSPGWQLRPPLPLALHVGGLRALRHTGIVNAALRWLALATGEVGFGDCSALLRTPYLGGAVSEGDGRAVTELALRRSVAAAHDAEALARLADVRAPSFAAALRAARQILLGADRIALPGQWGRVFGSILNAAGWPGERPLDSADFQTVESFRELLVSMASCDCVLGAVPAAAAARLCGELAARRRFAPESSDSGVQVLDARDADGDRFDAVWVTSVTADEWPPPPRIHPLLPARLQQERELPASTPALARQRATRLLNRLVGSAAAAILSWPRESVEGPSQPSPLLGDFVTTAAQLEPGVEPEAEPGPPAWRAMVASSGVPEAVATDPPPPFCGLELPGGTGLLAAQARCPARAFVEHRLGGHALEPPASPLNPAIRGALAHRLLERLYRVHGAASGLATWPDADLVADVQALCSELLPEFVPGADPFSRRLRDLEIRRLTALVRKLAAVDRGRPAFNVTTELKRELALAGRSLNLRIDRVDTSATGETVVFDYKTGQVQFSRIFGSRPREPQLAAYALSIACVGVGFIQLQAREFRLRGIAAEHAAFDGVQAVGKVRRAGVAGWEQLLAAWRQSLELLVAEFIAGDFRLDREQLDEAGGQFALVTRVHDLRAMGGGVA